MTIEISAESVPLVDLSVQHREIAGEVVADFERIMKSGAFVLGSDVADFETEFAAYSGVRHCIGVANGTDAIELALRAARIGAGDEVIIPANTFIATAGAVARTGAMPVLVDCDPQYLLIDPNRIEPAITSRTKAIVPVHLYGQLAPMEAIREIADRHGLRVIEDAAQAQGADRAGSRAGAWGDAAATSFYPGKNLGAYGDAGAVLTNSAAIAATLRGLRNHGSTKKYQHPELGFNSRMDTMQAAVLRAKLRRLDSWNEQRRVAAERYARLLAGSASITLPAEMPANTHVWHLYVVQVVDRDRVLAALNDAGIGAGIHYPVPVHLHGAYVSLGHSRGDFPVAEAAADRILSLPLYPGITADQQEHVANCLLHAL